MLSLRVSITPSSATSSPLVTNAVGCPTSTVSAEDDPDSDVSLADATIMGETASDRDVGTTLICRGGGAVAAAEPLPLGFACRGGGAWACTIC